MSDVMAAATPTDPVPVADSGNAAGGASSGEQSSAAIFAENASTSASAGDAGESSGGSSTSANGTSGESPNAGAAPAESASGDAAPSSAPAASGDDGGSSSDGSSGAGADDALHVQIAGHLEAIYQLALNSVENPGATIAQVAGDLKEHVADVLHKIRNGMAVAEGELVAKLEALFHKL
jgi:hypothetical protein